MDKTTVVSIISVISIIAFVYCTIAMFVTAFMHTNYVPYTIGFIVLLPAATYITALAEEMFANDNR